MKIERIKILLSLSKSWKLICCSLIILSALLAWRLYSQTSASAAQPLSSAPQLKLRATGERDKPVRPGAAAEDIANIKESGAELWSDEDRDGIPDRAELRTFNDRENFRRWFTAI